MEHLVTTDLNSLNIGNTPSIRNARRAEMIDAILCSRDLLNQVKGWKMLPEPSLSDHSLKRVRIAGRTRKASAIYSGPQMSCLGRLRYKDFQTNKMK